MNKDKLQSNLDHTDKERNLWKEKHTEEELKVKELEKKFETEVCF